MSPDLLKLIFGRLTFESLPLHEPIVVATFAVVATGGLVMVAGLKRPAFTPQKSSSFFLGQRPKSDS